MHFELVDIQPREIKFTCEPRKQSSCTVHLVNKTDKIVAFKVKTTNPKKYYVRPNTGVISSKSSCEFKIIMQAQREMPPDMICKDKFLVQSKVVQEGTSDNDITSQIFSKDDGKYVQENKLRVILVTPTNSPVIDGEHSRPMKFESPPSKWLGDHLDDEPQIPIQKPAEKVVKQESVEAKDSEMETTNDMEKVEFVDEINATKSMTSAILASPTNSPVISQIDGAHSHPLNFESSPPKWLGGLIDGETQIPLQKPAEDEAVKVKQEYHEESVEANRSEIETTNGAEKVELGNEDNAIKSMLNVLQLKLSEAEATISELVEEKRVAAQERESLHCELERLRSCKAVQIVHVGFSLLYVVMVSLVSLAFGYMINGK